MAIDSLPSSSESVPNQEQISVTREDDGSLSISISVDTCATASADGQSSSVSATGTEQATSDVNGTDSSYPTDQAGESDAAQTNDEALLTLLKDLSAKIDEVIELLSGLSDGSTAGETQPLLGEPPADPYAVDDSGGTDGENKPPVSEPTADPSTADPSGGDEELMGLLEGMLTNVEQALEMLGGGESAEQVGHVPSALDKVPSQNTGAESSAPYDPAADFGYAFSTMDSEGQAEAIERLASGQFGEDGVKIAQELQKVWIPNEERYYPEIGDNEIIRDIMNSGSESARDILWAIEDISWNHRKDGDQFINTFVQLSTEGKNEVIDLLASGQFGEDGKQIAEALSSQMIDPNDFEPGARWATDNDFSWNQETMNEIKELMLNSDEAEEILSLVEQRYEEDNPAEAALPPDPEENTPEYRFGIGFSSMVPEGRDEVVDRLASGKFGEAGVQLAQELQSAVMPIEDGEYSAIGDNETISAIMAQMEHNDFESLMSAMEEIMFEYGEEREESSLGDQFINAYIEMDSDKQPQVIELLESGEFGKIGKQVAEALPNLIVQSLGDMAIDLNVWNEIENILLTSEDPQDILAAVESINQ
jgi:hypothetical protein